MDECKHCEYRGDIEKCKSVSCSKHHTWYAEAQQQEIEVLRAQLTECIAALKAMLNVDVVEADKTYGTACKMATQAVRQQRSNHETIL